MMLMAESPVQFGMNPSGCASQHMSSRNFQHSTSQSSASQLKEWMQVKIQNASAPEMLRSSSDSNVRSKQKAPAAGSANGRHQPLHPLRARGSLSAIPEHLIPPRSNAGSVSGADSYDFEWQVGALFPVLGGRLFFAAFNSDAEAVQQIQSKKKYFFFSTVLHESYEPLCSDFGPVDMGLLHAFCRTLKAQLNHPQLTNRPIVYYSTTAPEHLTNAAFLLSAFLVMEYGLCPEDATSPFTSINRNPFLGFRDATFTTSTFEISIQDCCAGLSRAIEHGLFEPAAFRPAEYENLAQRNISKVTDKFIAFAGPKSSEQAEACLTWCQEQDVTAIIRLNEPNSYMPSVFETTGVRHYDLFFEDCTNPSEKVIAKFFQICNAEPGRIAIHCSSGLTRTGTMLSMWLQKNHNFAAKEAIGFLRLMRPGSVIGAQQQFLEAFDEYKEQLPQKLQKTPPKSRRGSMADGGRRGSVADGLEGEESLVERIKARRGSMVLLAHEAELLSAEEAQADERRRLAAQFESALGRKRLLAAKIAKKRREITTV